MSIDMEQIWREVKANGAKLDNCKLHDFSEIEYRQGYNRQYRCKYCGGVVTSTQKRWYDIGLRHKGDEHEQNERILRQSQAKPTTEDN